MQIYDLFNGNVLLNSYGSYKEAFEVLQELYSSNRVGNFTIKARS